MAGRLVGAYGRWGTWNCWLKVNYRGWTPKSTPLLLLVRFCFDFGIDFWLGIGLALTLALAWHWLGMAEAEVAAAVGGLALLRLETDWLTSRGDFGW